MSAFTESFVFAITDGIPKFDIGPGNSKQTHGTMLSVHSLYLIGRIKLKRRILELSITVADDKPIYHSPRRLPFTERDIVDKANR
ncbi:hypothetical protein TNIN_57311 [Trichonephila inaurata madagascariensis]|uniref:Uncharacterized protein n=1 Tax=Trichonephila inaurata madagascariensis TaxID=2747483 RepID=A0A8X7BTE3_9ARAC|nr:hypothetical protein TNIN_57311 [Trichonephila inaurata madagascariensis]